jgi:hypothetical protein
LCGGVFDCPKEILRRSMNCGTLLGRKEMLDAGCRA